MQIILQPVLAALDYSTLQSLANDVSKEFKNTKVTVGSSYTQTNAQTFFQSDFDRNRNQWNSPKLLQSLSEKFSPDIDTKTLFIFDGDAYSYGLNFVFGEDKSSPALPNCPLVLSSFALKCIITSALNPPYDLPRLLVNEY
jgi:predicted Zn-dependent protease